MKHSHHPSRGAATSSSTDSSIYQDEEFGAIRYRRLPRAQHVRIRLATDGTLRASLPLFAPLASLQKLIDSSREQLRKISGAGAVATYQDAQLIGHSHVLSLLPNTGVVLRGSVLKQKVVISYPRSIDPASSKVQATIKTYVEKALRIESKAYLPRRLGYLADQGQFRYERVRFAHQSGRWGSCSSRGTISLNIALMTLPFELIDYVLIHELAHTIEMNHSPTFWSLVESFYPDYKNARKRLKTHNPYL